MMEAKSDVLTLVKEHLPFAADMHEEIKSDMVLSELGLDSMRLITVLLILQHQYGFNMNEALEGRMPQTVGDLIALVDRHACNPS